MDINEIAVDVAFQKVVDVADTDETEIKELIELVGDVAAYMRSRNLTEQPDARWVNHKIEPIYDPGHLVHKSVFTSVLTLTYKTAE